MTSLPNMLVPTYLNMLAALSAWLTKAADRVADADELMGAKLADDMFPLATQIRFSCRQALEGMHRLAGTALTPFVDELLEEGRNAADEPGSIEEAQTRITQTLERVRAMAKELDEGDSDRPIEHALPNGMVLDLTAEQFVRDWAIGQFYFHVMAAYAILRRSGVELGKADYVAHVFAHIRPGTGPSAVD